MADRLIVVGFQRDPSISEIVMSMLLMCLVVWEVLREAEESIQSV